MKKVFALALMSVPLFAHSASRPIAPMELGPRGPRQEASPRLVTVYYERSSEGWATADLAASLRTLAKEIRQAKRLLFEEHQVPVLSPIELEQNYFRWFRPGEPRYSFAIEMKLGEGRLRKSEEQHGALLQRHDVLASDERGPTAGQLADYLDGLAEDLSDGVVSFEGNRLEIGETVDFFVVHSASENKAVHRVQIALRFGEEVPREESGRGPLRRYKRESESLSMAAVGKLLEQLGREIQDNGSISIGGGSFAVAGQGGFQISSREASHGGSRTEIEFTSDRAGPSGQMALYVPYERRSRQWRPAELAKLLAALGGTLASRGIFVMEDDTVALDGTASIVRRLEERFQPGTRQYTFSLNAAFGRSHHSYLDETGDLPIPEEEYVEELAARKELARVETTDVDQAPLAELLGSLSRDLEARRVRLGGKELAVGEDVDFRFKHTSSMDGMSHRIQVAFSFGEPVPRGQAAVSPARLSYSRESRETPMRDVGELLQRIGSEIVSDGRFHLGGAEFRAGETAHFEIKVREGRGLEIKLSYSDEQQQ